MTDDRRLVQKFNSLTEFVEFATLPTPDGFPSPESRSTDAGFTGTRTFQEAVDLSAGWTEGADRIEKVRVSISGKGKNLRREVVQREVGPGTISMGHYLQGHPQPMTVIRDRNAIGRGHGRIVRVYVNIAASRNIKTSVIERRGAAILALVDALQRAGRRVEVTVVQCVTNGSYGLEQHVTVKRAEARLNLPSLAFALAHPSMLRRLCFAADENIGKEEFMRRCGIVYGFPADMIDRPKDAIYLGQMGGGERQWKTDDAAAAWVTSEAAKQGVTLK